MTVAEVIDCTAQFMGDGLDPANPAALDYYNSAVRFLWEMEDWRGTIDYLCANVRKDCFILPYGYQAIRRAWINCKEIPVKTDFSWRPGSWSKDCKPCEATKTGRIINDPANYACDFACLFVAGNDHEDEGKEVTFRYRNGYGSIIEEAFPLASAGEEVVIHGSEKISTILSLTKPVTYGEVHILNEKKRRIWTFFPEETHASYPEYSTNCRGCILIKAKKKMPKYTADRLGDEAAIDSVPGLASAYKAVDFMQKSELQKYQGAMLIAKNHLDIAKENDESDDGGFLVAEKFQTDLSCLSI